MACPVLGPDDKTARVNTIARSAARDHAEDGIRLLRSAMNDGAAQSVRDGINQLLAEMRQRERAA